jgi:phage terminase Nu1 subunit (DNA packaging protein)
VPCRGSIDVREGSCFWPDDEGSDFADLEAAEHEATVTAISIGRELLRHGNECALTVEVRDDRGERVTTVTMTVTGETVTMKVAQAVASVPRAGVRKRPRNFA